jgi:predicted dehydrogenase
MKRREFIQTSTAAAVTLGFGNFTFLQAQTKGANEKIVLALIGCGGRGISTIVNCCKINTNVEIKTLCDVNRTKLAKAADTVKKTFNYTPTTTEEMLTVFDDKDIDAAWIATVDHWHTLAAVRACLAGKDVYVEKNPTHFISEGRKLIAAAEKNKRVVEVGCQNRSAPYNMAARDYIQSGKLGKIVTVKVYFMLGGGKGGKAVEAPVPAWLDWDRWLGPAPLRPFSPSIVSENGRGGWQNFWSFSGGKLSDEASHTLDLARMVLGDPPHPKAVYCWGGNHALGGESETPEYQEITYDFGNFAMTCSGGPSLGYMTKTPSDIRFDVTKFPAWRTNSSRIEIYGTKGLMYLGRHGGGWQVVGKDDKIVAEHGGIFPDDDHQKNFIESLRGRKKPNGDAENGHRSATLVHLGNISYRVGCKQLLFDEKTERFTNNDAANALAEGTYRKGYEFPVI